MSTVSYTTSDGTVFDLQCETLVMGQGDLLCGSWSFDDDTGAWSRRAREYAAPVCGIDRDEVNLLLRLSDGDVASGSSGSLEVDGWRLACVVSEVSDAVQTAYSRAFSVKFRAEEPVWRRHTTAHLLPATGTASGESLDYPHDHEFDYDSSGQSGTLPLSTDGGFLVGLTFFGPCQSPYVRLSSAGFGNVYGVDATAFAGERIVIDPLGRRKPGGAVYKVGVDGERTNLYASRRTGASGSGSYVFERAPAGRLYVTWPQAFGVDVDVIEERGVLPWT